MDAVPGYRACYECPCGAYRWQRSAWQKGETHCLACGTPFTSATLRFYRKNGGGGRWTSSAAARPWTSSAAAQQYFEQRPKGGAKGKGKGGPGNPKGKGGQGSPWLQQPRSTQSGAAHSDGRAAAGAAQAGPNTINYNRASKDALHRAQKHYEIMCGLYGASHAHALAAKQGLEEATREALEKKPPAQKLGALRQEHKKAIEGLHYALQRSDEIEDAMDALQKEYYLMEETAEQSAKQAYDLQVEIDAFEADLPPAVTPGEQMGIRDQLHSLLQAHVRKSGREFTDRERKRTCANIDELLRDFEAKPEAPPDAAMDGDDLDSLPALSDDDAPAPKQRRAREREPQEQADVQTGDDEWEKGLGAIGKKLARRGLLCQRTAQHLHARRAGQGGKAKGKGHGGKDKGKSNSYSAALQAQSHQKAATAYTPPIGKGGASSSTGLPGAAIPPGVVVPAGGNLTGGWPQLGASAASGMPAAQDPIDAATYAAHQAQLRRGEGHT